MVHTRTVSVTNDSDYAELAVTTNFSFLYGASHPEEFVKMAQALGLTAIGVADRNTLAGVVRAHVAAKELGMRLLVGARLVPRDGPELLCYPKDRAAYGRLSALLSQGKMGDTAKGECHITLADIHRYSEGQVFVIMPPTDHDDAFGAHLETFRTWWRGRVYLATHYAYHGANREQVSRLASLSQQANIPLVATNDVLYHAPNRRPLQDVLTCVREGCTVHEAGYHLEAHAERHLKPATEVRRLFKGYEDAVSRTMDIVRACTFSLDELSYCYPNEPVPDGSHPQAHLEDLAWKGADWRYPYGVPDHVTALLKKELSLIDELEVAPYFLTVHDIVAWARERKILCQGRGSAANSAVCFCLGVTSVDPATSNLLFERFLSKERKEPPDIDVDFEHERREEVIQYVYERYGRHRAALTATVISYRPRSAVRDVCKALGVSPDIASVLAGTVWGSFGSDVHEEQVKKSGLDPQNPSLRRVLQLTRQLIGFPRHLSQHVGGFVLTEGPLVETVPIGNAAMPDRTFIEWDKDDINALGIMKVDVLALGMLTCIRKAFDLLAEHKGIRHDLASIPPDDKATYDMLCRGDSLGVFQVESRAQMNMLPRLRPRKFYDLVIEVAIVRPGPIQGDMVHPYLRRRQKIESVDYPSPAPEHGPPDELEAILKRTLGVPLFQEQAMQISIDAAKFTPEEANGLRRAMATFRRVGTISNYQSMMVDRMVARGYDADFAQRCFDQVKGFGEYGFPESHAASFALLVYVSSWLKCHHPEIFCAALLNSQPMGFYAPAQIVRDAVEHGVHVLPPDVNASHWDNSLEHREEGDPSVRLGFRQVDGLQENEIDRLTEERGLGYEDVDALRRRAGLHKRTLELLASGDAFGSLALSRRQALWAVKGKPGSKALPLFEAGDVPDQGAEEVVSLPTMPTSEEVLQDYQTTRLSVKAHPLSFLRSHYARKGLLSTASATSSGKGRWVKTAGLVLVRQMPGSAKGVVFITIEDETGVANLVVWQKVFQRYRAVVMGARIIEVRGLVQRADNVTHIVAQKLFDRTEDLQRLSEDSLRDPMKNVISHADEVKRPVPEPAPRHGHPRNVRTIPKSRDFH
ncbi:MAG: error-prone DNA polymerase [Parvularculaceae bacterium]|nr:error-prone DNA polymerase [Parvularculaceae bacterium]